LRGGGSIQSVILSSCGAAPTTISRVYLAADTSTAFTLQLGPADPIELAAATSETQPQLEFWVDFSPTDLVPQTGTLWVESTDPIQPTVSIGLTGQGAENECPVPVVVQSEFFVSVLDLVTLDGSPSYDGLGALGGSIVDYEWFLVEAPEGSLSVPFERYFDVGQPANGASPDDTVTPTARFFPDVDGDYAIELRVTDNYGLEAASEACPAPVALVRIHAAPRP
jgi:hypothetical protein